MPSKGENVKRMRDDLERINKIAYEMSMEGDEDPDPATHDYIRHIEWEWLPDDLAEQWKKVKKDALKATGDELNDEIDAMKEIVDTYEERKVAPMTARDILRRETGSRKSKVVEHDIEEEKKEEGSGRRRKMPYKLRKAPKRELYWVITKETGEKHSKEPLPKEKAKAQMRALYRAMNLKGGARDANAWLNLSPEAYEKLKDAYPLPPEAKSSYTGYKEWAENKKREQYDQMTATRQKVVKGYKRGTYEEAKAENAKFAEENRKRQEELAAEREANPEAYNFISCPYDENGERSKWGTEQATPEECNRRYMLWESKYDKTSAFFRPIMSGLTKAGDFLVGDVLPTIAPGVGSLVSEAYKTFAPPGSQYHSGSGSKGKGLSLSKPGKKSAKVHPRRMENPTIYPDDAETLKTPMEKRGFPTGTPEYVYPTKKEIKKFIKEDKRKPKLHTILEEDETGGNRPRADTEESTTSAAGATEDVSPEEFARQEARRRRDADMALLSKAFKERSRQPTCREQTRRKRGGALTSRQKKEMREIQEAMNTLSAQMRALLPQGRRKRDLSPDELARYETFQDLFNRLKPRRDELYQMEQAPPDETDDLPPLPRSVEETQEAPRDIEGLPQTTIPKLRGGMMRMKKQGDKYLVVDGDYPDEFVVAEVDTAPEALAIINEHMRIAPYHPFGEVPFEGSRFEDQYLAHPEARALVDRSDIAPGLVEGLPGRAREVPLDIPHTRYEAPEGAYPGTRGRIAELEADARKVAPGRARARNEAHASVAEELPRMGKFDRSVIHANPIGRYPGIMPAEEERLDSEYSFLKAITTDVKNQEEFIKRWRGLVQRAPDLRDVAPYLLPDGRLGAEINSGDPNRTANAFREAKQALSDVARDISHFGFQPEAEFEGDPHGQGKFRGGHILRFAPEAYFME